MTDIEPLRGSKAYLTDIIIWKLEEILYELTVNRLHFRPFDVNSRPLTYTGMQLRKLSISKTKYLVVCSFDAQEYIITVGLSGSLTNCFFTSSIACPSLDFGLPPRYPQVVWCH